MSALLDAFRSGFDALPAALREAGELGAARRAALESALADGLPKARAERWKYTSLRALERRSFAPSTDTASIDPALLAEIPSPRLVFVNGRFDAALSRTGALPDGLILRPLSGQLADGDARAVNFLARRFDAVDETFARLNAALATEGALLRVEAGLRIEAPVHLVFIGAPAAGDQAWHLRHLVELREGSELTVVEHHLAAGAHAHLGNALCHVHLKPAARLIHLRLQDEAEGATSLLRTDAVLASEAEYRRFDLELGAGLSRHELNVSLQGRGARLLANGVLLADGRRHLDTRLGIDHAAPETTCELTWRGLAGDRGRAVFHGGIEIRAGADGSEAMLANKNLLLSEGAEIDTQPVLLIHADEVKAAHGATVGQLDAQALFYLRSRGIPQAAARALLTAAFCREPLQAVASGGLAEALAVRLDAALARAEAGE
jgi:Fe-S cluster assembly protein SufD